MMIIGHQAIPIEDPRVAKSIERNTQSPERDSYDLYRPSMEDNPQFVDMLPPPQTQEEPDHYAVKPRKTKKYSAVDEKEKKYRKFENIKAKIVVKPDDYDESELNQEANDYPASAEENTTQSTDESARTQREVDSEDEVDENSEEIQDKSDEIETAEASDSSVETSAPSSRLDFHMNGN